MESYGAAKALIVGEHMADQKMNRLRKLSSDLSSQRSKNRGGEVRKAAQEFEAIMLQQLFSTMEKTVEKSGFLDGGTQEEIYRGMLNQELAVQASRRGGTGISDSIVAQLEGTSPIQRTERWIRLPITRPSGLNATHSPQEGPPDSSSLPSSATYHWPVEGDISSPFGMRTHPFTGSEAFHAGIDIAQRTGIPVVASAGGVVIYSGWKERYGNTVIVQHEDGYTSLYAHNLKNLVEEGQYIQQGQVISLVGSTGRSTGSHLHFEIRKDGRAVDPLSFLRGTMYANADNSHSTPEE